MKKALLFWGDVNEGVVFGIILAIISALPVSARVLTGAGTYSQNFDSLVNRGTANTWTDNVTLPDTNRIFSAPSVPRPAPPRSVSVISSGATGDPGHRLPDSPRLATRQQPFCAGPSSGGCTIAVNDGRNSNLPSN
ncbi:MAG: hypothetical protein ACLQAH_15330 [Limisphaerales bacterium]